MSDDGHPVVHMSTIELELRALERVSLPRYPGSTLRGSLGRAFRSFCCVTGFEECKGCPQHRRCAYGLIWETLPPTDGSPKRFGQPPRPYVIDPALYGAKRTFLEGDRLAFRLKLFGCARDHVPYFIMSMREACRRGLGRGRSRLELSRVTSLDQSGRPVVLYDRDGFHRWAPLQELAVTPKPADTDRSAERVRLLLETPLQLTAKGKPSRRLDPEVLTARLTERLDSMCLFHESRQTSWDYQRLRALSRRVRIVHEDLIIERFERYSIRSDKRVPMTGLLGSVILDGVHPQVVSLWRTAEQLHVGKQATFGFGKIRVDRLDD